MASRGTEGEPAVAVSTNQFKNGMCIEYDGKRWIIVEFQHVKPGKGGAFVRTKLKELNGKMKTLKEETSKRVDKVLKETGKALDKMSKEIEKKGEAKEGEKGEKPGA